jgi:DNA mismatch repair ATPase MutS
MDADAGRRFGAPLPFGAEDVKKDLGLEEVIGAMAGEDPVIRASAETALLSPLKEEERILYRQRILRDCLRNPREIRRLYALAGAALDAQEDGDLHFSELQTVSRQFDRCLTRLTRLLEALQKLRALAEENRESVSSPGLQGLFKDLLGNLDDAFFSGADQLLAQLRFPGGMLIGARLSRTGRSVGHRLLCCGPEERDRLSGETFYQVPEGDQRGNADLLHRRELALADSNRILVRAVSGVCEYLRTLRRELAFYIGCMNLYELLQARGLAVCFPALSAQPEHWSAAGLTELCLGLQGSAPASNDLEADGCCLVTGADQGGKTTFLRSLGQAQLMLQCGMFTAASSFRAPAADGVYTHFQREEDRGLVNGKLGEELSRMSGIVDHLHRGSLVLCDESFCSTNEREGAEIALQVTEALRAAGVSVFAVTNLFPFARELYARRKAEPCTFLRAERLADGTRTRRILPGEPQRTSFCEDLYREIFQEA